MSERFIPSGLANRLGRAATLSLIAGTVGGAAVLAGQAFAARHRRYAQPELALALRATVGRADAPPLRLVLLGDSSALGVGVGRLDETIGGQLANLLAEGRAVAGCTCPASASPAHARPTWPPRWPGRCSASAPTWR